MLKSRVFTAIIMALIAMTAIFLLPPTAFTVVLAMIILGIGGWESTSLAGLTHQGGRIAWLLLLFVCGALLIFLMHVPITIPLMFGFATLFWFLLLTWLSNFSLGQSQSDRFQPFKLIICGLILLSAFAAFSWLQFTSTWLVLAIILVIAAADIGAYFTGRHFGGPKLAVHISPGKTWSGALGGIILATIVCMLILWQFLDVSLPFKSIDIFLVAALAGIVLAFLSIGGDLIISLMKRQRGLKDTSNLLPGHGGLLDRLDSLAAAAPTFALMVWYIVDQMPIPAAG